MNQKKARRMRREARELYEWNLAAWKSNRPSRFRIFTYLKWKKAEPRLKDYV